jgi:hypothetical protein
MGSPPPSGEPDPSEAASSGGGADEPFDPEVIVALDRKEQRDLWLQLVKDRKVGVTDLPMTSVPSCRSKGNAMYTPTEPIEIVDRFNPQTVVESGFAHLAPGGVKEEVVFTTVQTAKWVVAPFGDSIKRSSLEGDCSKATHIIAELQLGAFEVTADGKSVLKGGELAKCPTGKPDLTDPKVLQPVEGCSELFVVKILPLVD